MKLLSTCILLLATLFEGILAGRNCYYGPGQYRYCEYGCCGGDEDSWDSDSWDSWDNDDWDSVCCSIVAIIVGACIGGIAFITFIVVVVICCLKHKGRSGRIIGGSSTSKPTVAVINQHAYSQPMSLTNQTYGQPYSTGYTGYGGQPYGQPYSTGFSEQTYGQANQITTSPPPGYQAPYPPGPPPSAGIYNDPVYPPTNPPPFSGTQTKQ